VIALTVAQAAPMLPYLLLVLILVLRPRGINGHEGDMTPESIVTETLQAARTTAVPPAARQAVVWGAVPWFLQLPPCCSPAAVQSPF
jgi:hypothetical protein